MHTKRWEALALASVLFFGWIAPVSAQTTTTSPAPTITGPSNASGQVGQSFNVAINATNSPREWAIRSGSVPAGLHMDLIAGVIVGTPTQPGTYSLGLQAANYNSTGSQWSPTFTVTLSIAADPTTSPPVITGPTSASGTVGTAFSLRFTTTNNPREYAIRGGTLPPGLNMDLMAGTISGTPNQPGTFNFSVAAANAGPNGSVWGSAVSVTITVADNPTTPVPVITGPSSVSGETGKAFTATLTTTNNPTRFEIRSGTVPQGLSFDPTAGRFSGTPVQPGPTTLSVVAGTTTASGPVWSQPYSITFTITGEPPPPKPFISFMNIDAVPNVGGAGAPLAKVTVYINGNVLGTTTGNSQGGWSVTGTTEYAKGTYTLVATALYPSGASTTSDPSRLTIEGLLPRIADQTFRGQVGLPMTGATMAARGDPAPANFTATGLPAGISINPSTGAFSGTPTEVGTKIVTVTAENRIGGGSGKATFIIDAAPTPVSNAPVASNTSSGSATNTTSSPPPSSTSSTATPPAASTSTSSPPATTTTTTTASTTPAPTTTPPAPTTSTSTTSSGGASTTAPATLAGTAPATLGGTAPATPSAPASTTVPVTTTTSTTAAPAPTTTTVATPTPPPPVTTSTPTTAVVTTPPPVTTTTSTTSPAPVTTAPTPTAINSTTLTSSTSTTAPTTATKAPQTLSVSVPLAKQPGDAPFAVSASSSAGLPVTVEVVSGPAVVQNQVVALTGETGVVSMRVVQAGTEEVAPVEVMRSFMVAPASSQIANVSARMEVSDGDAARAFITGFVVGGTSPRRVLVRASGPSLAAFGVDRVLTNPGLRVTDASGRVVAENDDWSGAEVAAVANAVGAFPLRAGAADAAVVLTLEPGSYSMQVLPNGGTGIALAEVFDASDAAAGSTSVINVSTRGYVGQGEAQLTTGFVISGSAPKRVLVRATGPALTQFNVTGALADPVLTLHQGSAALAQNDNWETVQRTPNTHALTSTEDITAAARTVGAFALSPQSKDSAIVLDLAPGAYTATVSGAAGSTGIALVEVYEVGATR